MLESTQGLPPQPSALLLLKLPPLQEVSFAREAAVPNDPAVAAAVAAAAEEEEEEEEAPEFGSGGRFLFFQAA